MSGLPLEKLLAFDWIPDEDSLKTDMDFARLIVAGTIENIEKIDKEIEENLTHWDIDRLARVDLAILRQGIYSLIFQPDIDSHITIDEGIELAHEFSTDEGYRFINGVLDAVAKRHDST